MLYIPTYASAIELSGRLSVGEGAVPTKVLVVDDDVELTGLLKYILEPEGFDVVASNSGPEGLKLAYQVNPDVVIVDLFIPDMDGLEICRRIRHFSTVPILVLSAISKPGIVAKALDEGADDFMAKPLRNKLLVASLHKLTRRSGFGPMSLDVRGMYS